MLCFILLKTSVISVISVVDNGDCIVTMQLPVCGHQTLKDVIPAQAGIQTTAVAGVFQENQINHRAHRGHRDEECFVSFS